MSRPHREIVEEKLFQSSTLTPGDRELLQVRVGMMIVDALEECRDLLGELVTELKHTGPKTKPFIYERDVPIGSHPVSDDYPT